MSKPTLDDYRDRIKLVCKVNGYTYNNPSDERIEKDFGEFIDSIDGIDDLWRIDHNVKMKADSIQLF